MKSSIFSLCCCVLLSITTTGSFAQSGPGECFINYEYDVSGNRIKREYKCQKEWMPWDLEPVTNTTGVLTSLSPNPTTGPVTGVFSEPTNYAHVVVSTMGGIMILDREYHQTIRSFTIDISDQKPGNYLLKVSVFDRIENHIVTKLQ